MSILVYCLKHLSWDILGKIYCLMENVSDFHDD